LEAWPLMALPQHHRAILIIAASTVSLGACATLPVSETTALSARIEEAVGARPALNRQEGDEGAARVDAWLTEPVTPESAARIAVVNNPRVAAAFAQLGIARADFLDGALPANPAIHAARLIPNAPEADILKYGFGFDLMSLITLPARRRAAHGHWDGAKARAVGETLMVGSEARHAMIGFIAANQNLDLMRQANEASQAALMAAEAIFAAGNSAPIEVDRERLFAAEVGLTLKQAEAELVPARERVNASLGLSASQRVNWTSARRLPAPPIDAIKVDDVEEQVMAASTDFAAARGMLRATEAMRSTSGFTSTFPGLELSGERERDGDWKRGFGVGVGLPVFGLGGSTRLRADSNANLATASLASLDIELRAQARSTAAMAEAMRQIAVERRETILPLSAQLFSSTQLNFNAMQLGIFQLLEAKRARLDAGRSSISATRDYWMAQANLDLLLQGGRADGGLAPMRGTVQAPKPPAGH
jgi:cobalt-zinc-cadmium efflux system outer membrane protein